ncbi:MAG: DUF4179 domain-containing protein [Oscillospiraceae bacterium]
MRSTDERIAAVGQRTKALKRQQKLRRSSILGLSAIAAALVLIVGGGLAMPGIMAQLDVVQHLGTSGMASIFSGKSGMGYVLIALIAFALGVCVTILCLHLHRAAKEVDPVGKEGVERHD